MTWNLFLKQAELLKAQSEDLLMSALKECLIQLRLDHMDRDLKSISLRGFDHGEDDFRALSQKRQVLVEELYKLQEAH